MLFDTDLREDFNFSCLVISIDGSRTWLLDNEMEPIEIFDDIIGLGTGGVPARAARMAGATVEQAVEIAILCDTNSGGPVRTLTIGETNEKNDQGASYGGTAYYGLGAGG